MVSLLIILYILLVLAISLCIILSNAQLHRSHYSCSSSHTPDTSLTQASRAKKCYAFISKQMKDKCRTLPVDIDAFNEHLRRVTDMTYLTEQMSKCITPSLSCLREQLVRNAREMVCLVPPEVSDMSNTVEPSRSQINYTSSHLGYIGGGEHLDYEHRQYDFDASSHLDYQSQEYPENQTTQSARKPRFMPPYSSMGHLSYKERPEDILHPQPSEELTPTSHCSISELSICLSDEDDAYCRCCPPIDPNLATSGLKCKVAKRNCEECCQTIAIEQALKYLCDSLKQEKSK
uniref:Uncharacterized protein n=1 Tax=Cacopsylla melanoneura TaxID=428564 RepID=A0A8D9FE63_9HEMI